MISLLHTPDGVRDLYGEELKEKQKLKQSINQTISLYGYESIDTPLSSLMYLRRRSTPPMQGSCTNSLTRKEIRWF